MSKKGKGQGNQRADVKNPNNAASKATSDNRSMQLNPKAQAHRNPSSNKGK